MIIVADYYLEKPVERDFSIFHVLRDSTHCRICFVLHIMIYGLGAKHLDAAV